MTVNFNNISDLDITKKNISVAKEEISKIISGNSEHFYIQFTSGKRSIEAKWLRTENTDQEIIDQAVKLITSSLKK